MLALRERCAHINDSEIELILVYNADSGFFNIIKDALHKTISPRYQCNLCALTYGKIGMKDEWKKFVDKLNIPSEFIHRDEFLKKLRSHPHSIIDAKFSAIFLNKGERISLLISNNEINKRKTLKDLMDLITEKLTSV